MGSAHRKIVSFPWNRLARISRAEIELRRDLRASVRRVADAGRIASVLSDLAGTEVSIRVTRIAGASDAPRQRGGPVFSFESSDARLRFEVEVERDLIRSLVSAVFGQPSGWTAPEGETDPAVGAAFAAVVLRAVRRAHGEAGSLRFLGPGALRLEAGERRCEVDLEVVFLENTFSARATFQLPLGIEAPASTAEALRSLGLVPIALPIVLGVLRVERSDLASCRAGDVLLADDAFSVVGGRASFAGAVALVSPTSELGLAADRTEDGRLVFRGTERVVWEDDSAVRNPNPNDEGPGTDRSVLVRVECGSVSLEARRWSSLTPGQILHPQAPARGTVTLRALGQRIGRGSLLEFDGSLGIRIHEVEVPLA